MKLRVSRELIDICQQIIETNWTEAQWSEHEADDWFQTDHFEGGFDGTEKAFCFSYVRSGLSEFWFQLTLPQVHEVVARRIEHVSAAPAG